MINNNPQISTFTLLRFSGFKDTFWIFSQMGLAPKEFSKVPGLQFFKLLGSGNKDGFGKLLNPNVYAFHGVWESENAAFDFFESSPQFEPFRMRATEIGTFFMNVIKAHGKWSGVNPYLTNDEYGEGKIAVITRARIKITYIPQFWKYVAPVSGVLAHQPGVILSIGIGEYPWFMQATFSLWENVESMREYAYKNKLHTEVISKTRKLGWYSEELFANFDPYKFKGKWDGKTTLTQF
jgi:heme-degrading monooxygenase HmoA